MLRYVVTAMKATSRKKADLRFAQLIEQAGVSVNLKILYQPLYDPVA
jgi:hypothetical protein